MISASTNVAFDRNTNEPYNTGFEAYNRGMLFNDNPYPLGTYNHDMWAIGWSEAAS